MSIMVTGGAGYVGSVVVDQLLAAGETVVVIDNLSNTPTNDLPKLIPFYQADVGDDKAVDAIVRKHSVNACMHFAGLTSVGESVQHPGRYFAQNIAQSISLFNVLAANKVKHLVFSSSAAVYGVPQEIPIPDDHRHRPASPYGLSKSIVEQLLVHLDVSGQMRSISLRYFNAAGAIPAQPERHVPETHLIPLAIDAALGVSNHLMIFGTDYDTPDGTAIRDYIHVDDLARAHLLALAHLRSGGATDAFNLGNGEGYSVMEVVDAVAKVDGREVPHKIGDRRLGDPPILVASSEKARRLLGWKPNEPLLEAIVASAWRSRTARML